MTAPFDFRVDIAPDADPDGDPADWEWLDVSSYRRQKQPIELNQGRDDEADHVEAADSSAVFDLRDGYLSPRNPMSELYERIGPNTPIRYRLKIFDDDFERTVASGLGTSSSGHTWTTQSGYSVSSGAGRVAFGAPNFATEAYANGAGSLDIDFVYSATMAVLTTGGPWISAALVRRIDSSNYYRLHTEFKPAGELYMKWVKREAGSSSDFGSGVTVAATYAPGTKVWTRVQAVGDRLRARLWTGTAGDEPASGWDLDVDGATQIEGTGFGFYQWRFSTNTNVGALGIAFDDISVHALLWQGNVPEWPPRWDKSGRDARVPIAAAGPLRRIGQGDEPIRSPLARQLPRYSPRGYWPLEDGSDATAAGSGVSGGRSARVVDVTFGDDDCPPGASSSMKINSTGSLVAGYATGSTGNSWSALAFVKLNALPGAESTIFEWFTTGGTLRRWQVRADGASFHMRVFNADGTQIHAQNAAFIDVPTQWTAVQLETLQVGGNVQWALIWNRVGSETFWAMSSTINTHTAGSLNRFAIPGSAALVDARYSHIYAGTEELPFVDADFLAVSSGYAGEAASARIARLCAEEGHRIAITPGESEALGRQRAAKFLDLLRECAEADLGILYERDGSLGYIPRSARYNGAVAMTLDWTGGDLAEAPEPTDDDQRFRSRWTVKRTDGSEATYEVSDRRGRVPDSAEINIAEDRRLGWHAMWRTALTTIDELRWPVITIDLLAHPELIPGFLGIRIGSRIQVTNPKDQLPGISIDLIVEGIKQSFTRYKWVVDLACSPASVWQVGTWGTSRYSASTTTVQSTTVAGDTTFNITSTSRYHRWSTTATGYQWDLAGERVTVTSVGAAAGTGPYVQAVTVLRAQNGVSKDIPAGTPVKMVNPARWALARGE